jgi:uracil-DNA glycosylase
LTVLLTATVKSEALGGQYQGEQEVAKGGTMAHEFDSDYASEPYRTLCAGFPDQSVYPAADFRVEWGPIFHRGRLDGSAVVLAIGQDPAASENIARRILVGTAGKRFQGFLARLGITRSYVLVNAFLYSVYGGSGSAYLNTQSIIDYRNLWLDALATHNSIDVVVALGGAADFAWTKWNTAAAIDLKATAAYQHITHPTYPESSGGNNAQKVATATKALLQNWNAALAILRPKVATPDVAIPNGLYGTTFQAADLAPIPEVDLPPGIPEWMRNANQWAKRTGANAAAQRASITVTVPAANLP